MRASMLLAVAALGCGSVAFPGERLATFGDAPAAMAVDASGIYVLSGGAILAMPLDGAKSPAVLDVKHIAGALVLSGDDVLFFEAGAAVSTHALVAVPKRGGPPRLLATRAADVASGLFSDGARLYWTEYQQIPSGGARTPASIQMMPAGGGPVSTLYTTDTALPYGFASDGVRLFFTELRSFGLPASPEGPFLGALLPDGSVSRLAEGEGGSPQWSEGAVFWASSVEVARTSVDDGMTQVVVPGAVRWFDARGGRVVVLRSQCDGDDERDRHCSSTLQSYPPGHVIASADEDVLTIAADDAFVYWFVGSDLFRVRR